MTARRIVFTAQLEPVADASHTFTVRVQATEVLHLENNGTVVDSDITDFELLGFAPNGHYRLRYSYRGKAYSLPFRAEYGRLISGPSA